MDLIEQVGAFLGLVAFLALAVLVLLYFQQARDVRRLREWAGRAPERAAAAAEEAAAKAAEEAGVEPEQLAAAGPRFGERVRARLLVPAGLRERLPAARYLAIILAGVALVAVGVATGAFGLIGDEKGGNGGKGSKPPPPSKVTVAVLNGTGVGGAPGVAGLAETVANEVKSDGYDVGVVTDAESSFAESAIMYRSGDDKEATQEVADELEKLMGKTPTQEMADDVKALTKGARVAVVIGVNNSELQ
jgi:LytR cell envelope-related transcriptional attenuator